MKAMLGCGLLLLLCGACNGESGDPGGGGAPVGGGGTAGQGGSGAAAGQGGSGGGAGGQGQTVAHGDSITITGSGFGAHADVNDIGDSWQGDDFLNFRFKDHEDGVLQSDGFYPQRGGSPWSPSATELAVIDGGPANSTKHLRRIYEDEESGGLSTDLNGSGNQIYFTFKFMIAAQTQSGKIWRLYADAPQNNVYLSTGCNNTLIRGASECSGSASCTQQTEWGQSPALVDDTWHRLEGWVDASSNEFTLWLDGTELFTHSDWLHDTLAADGHTMDFPNMLDEPGDFRCSDHPGWSGSYHYDDLFIDFTRARVELGDAATWAGVSHREIQIPVSWSDEQVVFRLNRGAFPSGETVYAFVITESGTVVETGQSFVIGS